MKEEEGKEEEEKEKLDEKEGLGMIVHTGIPGLIRLR